MNWLTAVARKQGVSGYIGDGSDTWSAVHGHFFGQTMTGSSDATRALLDWRPTGPMLLDDIAAGAYTD